MAKSTINPKHTLCKVALNLAAKKPWAEIKLEHIATAAKIPLPQAKKLFSNTDYILPELIGYVDHMVAQKKPEFGPNDSVRDRIFEVMMIRFDILQQYRSAILSIMSYVKRTPASASIILRKEWQAMHMMLNLSGIKIISFQQPVVISGLLGIYSLTLCTWQRDTSADMAKTMAFLDRGLGYGGKLADIILRAR